MISNGNRNTKSSSNESLGIKVPMFLDLQSQYEDDDNFKSLSTLQHAGPHLTPQRREAQAIAECRDKYYRLQICYGQESKLEPLFESADPCAPLTTMTSYSKYL